MYLNLPYKNLALSGGGVLGIAYLGLLDYLYKINLTPQLTRIAGTSAGAITACLTSFNLSFNELKQAADSLDYNKVPGKDDSPDDPLSLSRLIPKSIKYSSSYLYEWIKDQIANQFDYNLKPPPYTFSDFRNSNIHKNKTPFKDLYIIGTDPSRSSSVIFSHDSTPDMEVAEAVRISMSVPLLFEAIKSISFTDNPQIYVDGGLLYNYPINVFDTMSPPRETLGSYFKSALPPAPINNLIDFISSTLSCSISLQTLLFQENKSNLTRSIPILTSNVQPLNFNIAPGDPTYNFLYEQGYRCTEAFFSLLQKNIFEV